jgi:hypothetical protein
VVISGCGGDMCPPPPDVPRLIPGDIAAAFLLSKTTPPLLLEWGRASPVAVLAAPVADEEEGLTPIPPPLAPPPLPTGSSSLDSHTCRLVRFK